MCWELELSQQPHKENIIIPFLWLWDQWFRKINNLLQIAEVGEAGGALAVKASDGKNHARLDIALPDARQ